MRINLFSLPVDAIMIEEALARIVRFLHEDCQRHVVTLNPEIILAAQKNPELKRAIQEADLVVPDGIGLVLAGRIVGRSIPERVTGIEVLERLAGLLELFQMRLVVIGGKEGAAEAAALLLHDRHPKLGVLWAGEELFVDDDGVFLPESDTIWARLKAQLDGGPSALLAVAFGSPKQELWIARYLSELPTVKVAMGVGGALDMLAGFVPRAPLPLRTLGFEWLWRLLFEPSRVGRIYRLGSAFPALVFRALHERRTQK